MKVLLICFANTCRSPVAESLLARAVPDLEVASRGVAGGSGETPPALLAALEEADLSLAGPPGAPLQREDARAADLLLFMERRLLRDAVVTDPTLWPRSFTLREFARRAFTNPPERDNETFEQWRTLLHAARNREELLGADDRDDIADPGLQGSPSEFAEMIGELRHEIDRVAPFLSGWSSTAR